MPFVLRACTWQHTLGSTTVRERGCWAARNARLFQPMFSPSCICRDTTTVSFSGGFSFCRFGVQHCTRWFCEWHVPVTCSIFLFLALTMIVSHSRWTWFSPRFGSVRISLSWIIWEFSRRSHGQSTLPMLQTLQTLPTLPTLPTLLLLTWLATPLHVDEGRVPKELF